MEDLDLDNLLNGIDETIENTETPVVIEIPVDNTKVEVAVSKLGQAPEVEKFMEKLAVNQDLADDETAYSAEFADLMTETNKYMEDVFEIDAEIRVLKSQLTDLKNEAKDIGVPVTAVAKAIKEMIKEIKESPDEAHNVEMMKRFITENENLYSEVSALC